MGHAVPNDQRAAHSNSCSSLATDSPQIELLCDATVEAGGRITAFLLLQSLTCLVRLSSLESKNSSVNWQDFSQLHH